MFSKNQTLKKFGQAKKIPEKKQDPILITRRDFAVSEECRTG